MDTMLSKEERILVAAEQVFAQNGYEKSTVDDIIALADVGKGTLYKYFGNKEQLFYKLVSRKNELFVERLDAAVKHQETLERCLEAFFTEMVAFYKENTALWQIICFEMLGGNSGCMVHTVDGVHKVVSRYNVQLPEAQQEQMIRYHMLLESEFGILQRVLQKGMDDGLLWGADIEVMTMYFFFGVAMCIFHPHVAMENATADEAAHEIVERMLHGVEK